MTIDSTATNAKVSVLSGLAFMASMGYLMATADPKRHMTRPIEYPILALGLLATASAGTELYRSVRAKQARAYIGKGL